VLRDVSLSVRRGEVVGRLGPNGAGKTTCFYSVMGLAMPDSGRILLDGHDITGLPMYRRAALGLGYLPQETSIFRGLTVEQNILAVLEVAEPDAKAQAATDKKDLLANEVAIAEATNKRFQTLMDGYEQRIGDLTAEVHALREEVKSLRKALDTRSRHCLGCPTFQQMQLQGD
jgi:lipopolysaccharide export system ATP-binding protein